MRILSLVALTLNAPICVAEKLTYFAPQPTFEIEYTTKAMELRTPKQTLKINATPCNKLLLERFWTSAATRFKRYPLLAGGAHEAHADFNGKKRWMIPLVVDSSLSLLDEEFLALLRTSQHKCKS